MSIECLNQALKMEFKGQTPTKRLILILLANYCDDKNSCYPSYKHIAKLAGLKDTKHIANIIKEFEQLGLLSIEHRKTKEGGHTSNRYHLTLRATAPLGASGEEVVGPDTHSPPVTTPSNTKEDTKEETKDLNKGDGTSYDHEKDNLRCLFGDFYVLYPRKIGRHMAEKSYEKECKSYDPRKMNEMAKRFMYLCKAEKRETQFIPHPATWLNQKRYLDMENNEHKIKKNTLNKIAG